MTPESKTKKEIREYLDSLGEKCWHVPYHNVGYGRGGVPDRIGCYRGVFFALEVKAKGKTATKWQRREIEGIIAAGGIAEVVWNIQQVKDIIESIDHAVDLSNRAMTVPVETVIEWTGSEWRRKPLPF